MKSWFFQAHGILEMEIYFRVGWINNNSNNDGVTNISWHQTCNNVQHLEITDFDGDGHDDVLVWTLKMVDFATIYGHQHKIVFQPHKN